MERILIFLFGLFTLLLCQCNGIGYRGETADLYPYTEDEEKNKAVELEHEKAWVEAYKYRSSITDTTFLQTKRPMSDDAIGPYNYHTGYIEDRAYNRVVYIAALDRAKKHLSVSDGKLVLLLNSGKDINIAEDLFIFIVHLFDEWNELIEEGLYRVVQTDDGSYDIEFITRNNNESL